MGRRTMPAAMSSISPRFLRTETIRACAVRDASKSLKKTIGPRWPAATATSSSGALAVSRPGRLRRRRRNALVALQRIGKCPPVARSDRFDPEVLHPPPRDIRVVLAELGIGHTLD